MSIAVESFILDDLIFPVAPSNLPGHGLDEFQWPFLLYGNRGGTFRRALWSWKRVAEWRYSVATTTPAITLMKTESDDRTFGFDFSEAPDVWDGSEVVDAIVSGVVSGGSGLTFGSVSVVVQEFDEIPINAGLKCNISGGDAGTVYPFAIIATLASGSELTIPCRMVVVADYPSS